MATQLTLDHCIGKYNYVGSETNWYGFNQIPINEDTRCEYCYRHMKEVDPSMHMFPIVWKSAMIDCDTILHPVLSMLELDGFRFQVVSHDMKRPFLIHPAKSRDRQNGLLCVELPKQSKFAVIIDPQVSKQIQNNLYYSFKMRVGEKEVVINEGKLIYYKERTSIHGYSPTVAFEFKAEGKTPNEYEAKPENLIRIELTVYKRDRSIFTKIVEMPPMRIQLGYIDPARYQVPAMHETYKKIVEDADDYYYNQTQARLREQFRQHSDNVSGSAIVPTALCAPSFDLD